MATPTDRRRPKALTIAVIVLAIIGAFSVIGWVMSAFASIIKLAILAVLVVAGLWLLKAVLIGKPRPEDNLPTQRGL